MENSPDDDVAYGLWTVEEGNDGGKPLNTLDGAAWGGEIDVAAATGNCGNGVVAAAGGNAAGELGGATATLRPMQPEMGGML